MSPAPWSADDSGLTLLVRLTPKADRDRIDGIVELSDGRAVLAARVRAVPEKGAANKALAALFAKRLKIAKSSVILTGGSSSRIKTLRLEGRPEDLLDRLIALME
ncbi:MAG TPA: DUF167 family protein [Afifellaceae bacterium]|nr:DUF167 family protein [Afifellaceae bacterium]